MEGDGKKEVWPAHVGGEANRFPEPGDRLVFAASHPDQGEPQADVAPGVVGVQADGLLVLGDGPDPAVQTEIQTAEGVVERNGLGPQYQGGAIVPDGLHRVGLMGKRIAHLDVHPEVGGVGRRDALQESHGVEVPGPQAHPEYG